MRKLVFIPPGHFRKTGTIPETTRKFTDFKNYLEFDEDMSRMKSVKKYIKNRRANFVHLQKSLGKTTDVRENFADNEY